jgi:peptide/nickel transport system permease protein
VLLAELQRQITVHPLAVVWPGLAITLTVLGLNLLGDSLREATDPTLSRGRDPMAPPRDAIRHVPGVRA